MEYVLGIDTSNYTTSLCALEVPTGRVAADVRQRLPVPPGSRGLRQSAALFHHVQRLPQLLATVIARLRATNRQVAFQAIGVSVRPRPIASSYMPVFGAGTSLAESLGCVLSAPVVRTSHQEGHLRAASADDLCSGTAFLAVHLSGGTSDVLYAQRTDFGYAVHTVAQGADLHAGQFVDRVGVALGCSFPAGAELERLAEAGGQGTALRFPSSVLGAAMSFSGPCSAALRAVAKRTPAGEIARAVEITVANTVVKAVLYAARLHPDARRLVVAGGVAENRFIRNRIKSRLTADARELSVTFAPFGLSSDNAVGVALIAAEHWCRTGH